MVHVRGLAETVVEADLIEAVQPFGNVGYVQAGFNFGRVQNVIFMYHTYQRIQNSFIVLKSHILDKFPFVSVQTALTVIVDVAFMHISGINY